MSEPSLHSPAHVIQQLLVAQGLGAAPTPSGDQPAWPVYVENEPDKPDNAVTVYDVVGVDHGRTAPDHERQTHYGIQIRVRARDHETGWPKARALALALDALYDVGVTVGAVSYVVHSLNRTGDVVSLGPEQLTHRRLYTINLLTSIRALA